MKRIIELEIGSKTAKINGESCTLDVPPQIVNGRTMVPFRFIGEAFGAEVDYSPKIGRIKRVTAKMEVPL